MKNILFITNGHGEDLIATSIIKQIQQSNPDFKISAFPMVGEGRTFEPLRIEILGTKRPMPSGGFMYLSFKMMIKDVSAGLINNTLEQIKMLKQLRGKYDLAVAIGDIVPVIAAAVTKIPFLFYGCAKSDYYNFSYTFWEKWIMKKYAIAVLPRDKKTTENLKKIKIKSEYVGNPMMDAIKITGEDFGISPNSKVVGVLPGSRDDAFINIDDSLKIILETYKTRPNKQDVNFLIALAMNLDPSKLSDLNAAKSGQWTLVFTAYEEKEKGIEAKLISGDLEVKVCQSRFGDVLNKSNIIIGLSGTGNEQAVGLGKPVVTFGSRGVQHTKKFAKMKKELLGDSISLVDSNPKTVAGEIWKILNDPIRIENMRRIGRERMGSPGATDKIAEKIIDLLK